MLGVRRERYEGFDGRLLNVAIWLIVAFSILVVRLWFLQLVRWSFYAEQSENNRLSQQRLSAPRGIIYGRNGEDLAILADNRPACDLMLVPAECDDPVKVATRLETLLGIDALALQEEIKSYKRAPYTQIPLKRDVSRNELTIIEEFSYALPGVIAVARPHRRYIHGKIASQILGFLGEVGPEELKDTESGYRMKDLMGRAGLESMHEGILRGKDGKVLVTSYCGATPQFRTDEFGRPSVHQIRDSYGNPLSVDMRQDPVPGNDLYTTLDVGLQKKAEEVLGDEIGAIAVLDASTGAVLALASTPGYDPSVFVTEGSNEERNWALTDNLLKPMQNRCYQEVYAPGSVFKIILASAALEEGVIDESSTHYCPGFFNLPNVSHTWHCWKRPGHGTSAVVDALAFSCDVFFYNVGMKLGVDKINEYAEAMGLSEKTGLDLPVEVAGIVDSRPYKRQRRMREFPNDRTEWSWYDGDTVNLAIGQGATTTTPLQNAVMMAVIVNGGYRVTPYLDVRKKPALYGPVLSEATVASVRKGMSKCVEKDPPAPTGTGNLAKIEGLTVLGKTGSAQVVSLERHEMYENEDDIPYEWRDHAWFVAGVLGQDPPIAICVMVEHGHHGSSVAAPKAREVIKYFYERQRPQNLIVARSGVLM